MNTAAITLDSVLQARERLRDGLRLTPCTASSGLSRICGMSIFLKRDFEQVTGSFKERGARHALLTLSRAQRSRGVVAASAGNHALGLAYHGAKLGVKVTVVMPKSAPRIKVERCRSFGARVVLTGNTYDEAAREAEELAAARGLTFVHPFDNPDVMAGQGTVALEVLDQVAEFDAIVVPAGGGGLLAGVSTVLKSRAPSARVIAVEPAHAPSLSVAMAQRKPVSVTVSPGLADGLSVSRVGHYTFDAARHHVHQVLTVTEDEIAEALLQLAEQENLVVEGAAATTVAACLSGRLEGFLGKRVVLCLTGRNIDPLVHERALWRARVARAVTGYRLSSYSGQAAVSSFSSPKTALT